MELTEPTASTLQLDLDDLEWRAAGAFRQVGEGVHVLHRSRVRVDVLTPTIRVGELSMGVGQEDRDGLWVAVHHRFFARFVLDAHDSDTLVLELDFVMLRIKPHWVVADWLGYSCGCHIPSVDLVRWAQV